MINLDFEFTAELWKWNGIGSWHFITLPEDIADKIKFYYEKRHGFGQIAIKATIGKTSWNTSIFPDKKSNSFLLPIKSQIRKKENLTLGSKIRIMLVVSS